LVVLGDILQDVAAQRSSIPDHHVVQALAPNGADEPVAKVKIGRFFWTARAQLLPTLVEADTRSLDALNRRFWAWLEDECHETPHRGLEGETPLARWAATAGGLALPPDHLDELFLFEEKRKVQKDLTVSLRGVGYEVDASLVGETVTLRYDPARATRSITVLFRDRVVDVAKPVDVYANCSVRRDHCTKALTATRPATAPPSGLSLRHLDEDF
jgi:hypothetical protein